MYMERRDTYKIRIMNLLLDFPYNIFSTKEEYNFLFGH